MTCSCLVSIVALLVETTTSLWKSIAHTVLLLFTETDFCNLFDFGSDVGPNCMPSVTDVAAQYPELTLVSALIERAELSDIFLCPGPFTALLPTNAAFDAVDPVFLEFLLRPENQEALEDVLLYHILPGAIRTNELQPGTLETLLPGEVITVENFPVMFNDAAVETADIEACNGIIDTIDSVLLPFAPRKFAHSTVAAWNPRNPF